MPGTGSAAAEALEVVLDTLVRRVLDGDAVSVTGFGRLQAVHTSARRARNPQTGERVLVPAGRRIVDPDGVARLTDRCQADTQALLAKASRHHDSQPELQSLTEREVADRILAECRTSALKRLLRSEEADAEAETVYEMVLRRHPTAHRAAEEAAEQARHRTAQYLLQQRLGQLRVLRIRAAAGRLPQRTP
ncbi:HU family DNA-binding protein [Streptomyces sp. SCL15-4]|uniref:HU family DNA-binding protein n=1 Tax=Streptomyces sp. SCL15-4 TaxID=2967221 RepID=UPI0029666F32|nr:HU family DNA-binding protein [Streptomyces sp. SCL15-4]